MMDASQFHAARAGLVAESLGGYESRKACFGPFTASFESVPAGFPPGGPELYDGLPDRACQVPHWGYVFSGRMRFTHSDGAEQVVTAGEVYYVPPGHRWECLEAAEIVEFSPTEPLEEHMRIVAPNLERIAR